jgi:uncharacterized membrane protein YeaQ/YmgE (transglycosylase-associated protein family)
MPTYIKVIVSIVAALAGLVASWLEQRYAGRGDVAAVILGLTAFMVVAMWLFPEAGKKDTGAG